MTGGRSTPPLKASWGPPSGRPAGWYPDSTGLPVERYYDGRAWSDGIRGRFAEPRGVTPTLDPRAAVGAVAVLLVSLLASRWLVEALLSQRWPILAYTAVSVIVGYGPSVVWGWWASRRFGTGHPVRDLGLRPKWSDIGWGPVVWLCVLGGQLLAGLLVVVLDVPFTSNTEGVEGLAHDRTYVISLLVAAVVAAPLVEEVIFRGVVQRGLRSRWSAPAAIGTQGIVFGLVHVDPVRGAGNVGLVIVLSTVGVVLGAAVELLGRLPPAMIAHAILNSIALAIVLIR
ncbi:MAG: type II CAAX prenyl endopeptidase Rce1 family protein [Desertimonas sp.]